VNFVKKNFQKIRVFGNLRGREEIWGYFGGSTTKIPPYPPLTPAIPREPKIIVFDHRKLPI